MSVVPNFFGDISDYDIKRIIDECDNSLSVEAFQNRDDSFRVLSQDMPLRNYRRGPKLASYTFHTTSE